MLEDNRLGNVQFQLNCRISWSIFHSIFFHLKRMAIVQDCASKWPFIIWSHWPSVPSNVRHSYCVSLTPLLSVPHSFTYSHFLSAEEILFWPTTFGNRVRFCCLCLRSMLHLYHTDGFVFGVQTFEKRRKMKNRENFGSEQKKDLAGNLWNRYTHSYTTHLMLSCII